MCVGRALVRVTSRAFPATATATTATTATDAQTFRLDDRCDRATPLSLERERESRERERSKKICQNNKTREEKKER